MKISDLKSSTVAVLSASVSSLCCLLPLLVVMLGLGSGAFMTVTMKYSYIFIPVGILGTGTGYYLYVRERKRCDRLGCRMVGRRANPALLVVSTVVLGVAVTLTALPDYTARLIASWSGTAAMEGKMGRSAGQGAADPLGTVALASATLRVDGMT